MRSGRQPKRRHDGWRAGDRLTDGLDLEVDRLVTIYLNSFQNVEMGELLVAPPVSIRVEMRTAEFVRYVPDDASPAEVPTFETQARGV
jgi:hypothetical protein